MRIDKLIIREYPTVGYYSGINTVRDRLIENNYLIVVDDDNNYKGVLTPPDLILRPHKIVADCLTPKDGISVDDTLSSTIALFEKNQTTVLPVFIENEFVGVVEKHGVFKELQMEVVLSNNKSTSAEKVKNNFLENLSHEIRTPLNGIVGFVELLKQNKEILLDKEAAGNIIVECTDRFLLTMQNLTELALIQSGIKECIRPQDIYVSMIFSSLDKYFQTTANRYGDIKIYFDEDFDDLCLSTDKEVLIEILFHFIINSINIFRNKCIYLGYLLTDDAGDVVFYVSNSSSHFGGKSIISRIKEDENENETMKSIFADGLGVALILIKEYGNLINAEIKVVYDNYDNTFYCKIPLTGKDNQLSHLRSQIIRNQN